MKFKADRTYVTNDLGLIDELIEMRWVEGNSYVKVFAFPEARLKELLHLARQAKRKLKEYLSKERGE